MKGGYQVIDLKGADITTEGGVTVKGAFAKVKTGKVVIFENVGGIGAKDVITYDIDINGTEEAICPVHGFVDNTPVLGYIDISSSDVIQFVIPE